MRLANPYFLGALWLIPAVVVFYVWAFKRKRLLIERFVSGELKDRLLMGVSASRQRLKTGLVVAGCTFSICALLQPQWGFHWEEIKRRGIDIILAIDVSKSMLAEDVSPNRLERAKRKISDFLRVVQGDRIGLIAFAGTAFLQCPLTLDHGAVQIFLDAVDTDLIPVPGTSISEAIELSVKAFEKSERNSRALILITDGEETTGNDLESAKKAGTLGIKIYTIGIGKEEGAPIPNKEGGGFKKDRQGNMILTKLDEQGLQKLALETGGSYVRSVSGDLDLEEIYTDLKKNTEDRELKSGREKRFEERFQWPLLLAFLCFFLEAVLSERKGDKTTLFSHLKKMRWPRLRSPEKTALIILILIFPTSIFASSAKKGESLFQQKKYNEALKELVDAQVENPNSLQLKYNTAEAYYKTNQFEEAEKLFQSVAETADKTLAEKAFYNLGNTAYRQGKLEPALEYFQKASELDPKDEDAKFNLEFVRKEIRRRINDNKNQQNQSGQPKSSDDKGDKKQDQKNSEAKNAEQPSQDQKPKKEASSQTDGKKPETSKEDSKGSSAENKEKKSDDKGASGQSATGKMSDEEAKQWLSTLKEADRSKFQKRRGQESKQYEVEKDW